MNIDIVEQWLLLRLTKDINKATCVALSQMKEQIGLLLGWGASWIVTAEESRVCDTHIITPSVRDSCFQTQDPPVIHKSAVDGSGHHLLLQQG